MCPKSIITQIQRRDITGEDGSRTWKARSTQRRGLAGVSVGSYSLRCGSREGLYDSLGAEDMTQQLEPLLFLQRSWVQFPVPTSDSS